MLGRLKRVDFSGGHSVEYFYDELGRLVRVISEAGIFSYEYDYMGRKTKLIYPNGVITSYSYDHLGRLIYIEHKNPQGKTLSFKYTYDPAGNVVKIVQNGEKV